MTDASTDVTYQLIREGAASWEALMTISDTLFGPAARALPSFSEVVGGVSATWIDADRVQHRTRQLADVQDAYETYMTASVTFSGRIGSNHYSHMIYYPGEQPTRLTLHFRVHPGDEQVVLAAARVVGFTPVTDDQLVQARRMQKLGMLASDLLTLEQSSDVPKHRRANVRGNRFERWIEAFFGAFDQHPTLNVVNPGEQIDFTDWFGSHFIIGEARWRAEPVGQDQVKIVHGKLVDRPAFVMGLIISMTGFTEPALQWISKHSGERTILSMDRPQLERILNGEVTLSNWILASLRYRLEHP